MKSELFIDILEQTLITFVNTMHHDGLELMQDNDPKHCSNKTKSLAVREINKLVENTSGIADRDPIENLWHELIEER